MDSINNPAPPPQVGNGATPDAPAGPTPTEQANAILVQIGIIDSQLAQLKSDRDGLVSQYTALTGNLPPS
jgi:hypothetical protein